MGKWKGVEMSIDESHDGAPTCTILWNCDLTAQWASSHRFSPDIEVLGIPWYIALQKESKDGTAWFCAYLHGYENDSILWSVDVNARFTLVNKDSTKNIVRDLTGTFKHSNDSCSWDKFIEWDDLIDQQKGFVNKNAINIEVRFTLRNIMGIRRTPRFDFTDESESLHDITLVIDGKKIYVNKGILALHSPVFKAMFYGNFAEKDKKEIELKDVDFEDFIEMLNMIYPTEKKITNDNVERLLSVGDRFQVKKILDEVEQFLIKSAYLTVAAKLKISSDYRLVQLQGYCLNAFKKVAHVISLKKTEEYNQLSDTTKLALLEKIMKLGE